MRVIAMILLAFSILGGLVKLTSDNPSKSLYDSDREARVYIILNLVFLVYLTYYLWNH